MAPAGLGALEIENERLRSELDTLRQHATATPTVRLRELNERQVGTCCHSVPVHGRGTLPSIMQGAVVAAGAAVEC